MISRVITIFILVSFTASINIYATKAVKYHQTNYNINSQLFPQNGIIPNSKINNKKKVKISFREVVWAISHPFIALKVKRISKQALLITDSLERNTILKDRSGGQLDAFKHAYWMASLSQEIKAKKARRIGEIHEKVNYRSFKKGNSAQDSTASRMDILNNNVGIDIGVTNKEVSKSKLIVLIIKAVKTGKLYRIKKDEQGNYLDVNNNIIDLSLEKAWNKRKVLVRSS